MSKTNTTIEINGKRYDAITGSPLSSASPKAIPAKNIDGIVRASVGGRETPHAILPKPTTSRAKNVTPSAKAVMDVRHSSGSRQVTTKKSTPESSKTLMRQAVKKPAVSFKRHTTVHTPTDVLARQPASIVIPKLSFHIVNPAREVRAQQIAQSKLISRFSTVMVPAHAHITPAKIPAKQLSQTPINALAAAVTFQQPVADVAPKSSALFERALLKANSHEQPAIKSRSHRAHKTHNRLANVSALSLAILLVGGFLVYQNMANLTMHLAASKAGFAATLPAFRPSGFSVGKFAYSPGNVTIHYHSNSDSARSFALTEQPSNWDSATLLNDFVSNTAGQNYQMASAAGRTVYVYGNNNATWVSGGVWYRVTNQNSLSTTQLITLASSM